MPAKNALLSAVCLVPLMATGAVAQNAGVTAAVNQSATGTPPGRTVRTISLGDNIVQNERVNTSGEGLLQILLADGTAFTVGPNSSLTIDRFVYDPQAGTAKVAATLSRGVFRFVGGRTSKSANGVALETPVGTVGIRGAVADIAIGPNGSTFSMVFGNEITLTQSNGSTERVYRPGYTISVSPNGTVSTARTPPGATNQIQQALAGQPGTSGGSRNVPNEETVAQSPVPAVNSGSRVAEIAPPIPTPRPPDPVQTDRDVVLLATLDTIRYDIALNTPPPQDTEPQPEPQPQPVPQPEPQPQPQPQPTPQPEPQPQPEPTPQPEPQPQPQPTPQPEPQPTPQPQPQPTPQPSPRSQLRVYPATAQSGYVEGYDRVFTLRAGQNASGVTFASGRVTGTVGGVAFDLPAFEDAAGSGLPAPLQVTEIGSRYGSPNENPTATRGSTPLAGTAYVGRDDFRAYLLATPQSSGLPSEAFYAVTGKETDVATALTGPVVRAYAISPDPWVYSPQYATPFSALATSGLPTTQSALLFAERPVSGSGPATALQVSFGISQDPGNPTTTQRSMINVVVGSVTGNGIDAVRRGGIRSDASFLPTASYFGTLATLPGPQGGGFFGTNGEYLVLSGTPGAAKPLYDRSVANTPADTSFSTTHVATLQTETAVGNRREGLLNGFNASLLSVYESSGAPTTTLMRNKTPSETRVTLSPGVNGLEGSFGSGNVEGSNGTTQLTVGFGGANGPSAYAGAGQYAATGTTGGVQLGTESGPLTPSGQVGTYMVSGRVAEVSGFRLCTACDFIEWGWWGTRAEGTINPIANVMVRTDANVHLGTWVAGTIATNGQIATAGVGAGGVPTSLDTASYGGGVLGTVRNGSNVYLAHGEFGMNWNFGTRVGNMQITGFDGRQQSTSLQGVGGTAAVDPARFRQSELGALNIDGAFVNGPSALPNGGVAAGVIGSFDWRDAGSWSATGVFGGTARPPGS